MNKIILATLMSCIFSQTSPSDFHNAPYSTKIAKVNATSNSRTIVDVNEIKIKEQDNLISYISRKYKKTQELSKTLVMTAYEEADRTNISPFWILAIIEQESAFTPSVTAKPGTMGLMQVFVKVHHKKVKEVQNSFNIYSIFHPKVNIRVGTEIIRTYLDIEQGNWQKALKNYSGGSRLYAENVRQKKEYLENIAKNYDT